MRCLTPLARGKVNDTLPALTTVAQAVFPPQTSREEVERLIGFAIMESSQMDSKKAKKDTGRERSVPTTLPGRTSSCPRCGSLQQKIREDQQQCVYILKKTGSYHLRIYSKPILSRGRVRSDVESGNHGRGRTVTQLTFKSQLFPSLKFSSKAFYL